MKKNRNMVRIIALVLALLMVGGVVVGSLFAAFAETPEPMRDQYTFSIEYMESDQALHITQRLIYMNRTGERLDRVVFYAAPNIMRRQGAWDLTSEAMATVFPEGFFPGGVDLRGLWVNGEAADYGFIGENEIYLRVACDMPPGAEAEFSFDYYLLLPRCRAFLGAGDGDIRLAAFYFIPGRYDQTLHEFRLNRPLGHTRWLDSAPADYEADIILPDGYDLAATGETKDGHVSARNLREFALTFGKRYRVAEQRTHSGVVVRVFSGRRDAGDLGRRAVEAIEQCEAWFGDFPVSGLNIAETDAPSPLNYPGLILLPGEQFEAEGERALWFCLAQQYFGLSAYPEPVADAWLSDSVSNYVSYWLLEVFRGNDAFLKAINRDWVSSLQLTIPGGLTVTSSADLFDAQSYEMVILNRGAVVLHELNQAMGRENLIEGLRRFYEMGRDGHTLTEMDFVHCMDAASGRSWEDFLTDWVFNVGDYVNQSIDWLN